MDSLNKTLQDHINKRSSEEVMAIVRAFEKNQTSSLQPCKNECSASAVLPSPNKLNNLLSEQHLASSRLRRQYRSTEDIAVSNVNNNSPYVNNNLPYVNNNSPYVNNNSPYVNNNSPYANSVREGLAKLAAIEKDMACIALTDVEMKIEGGRGVLSARQKEEDKDICESDVFFRTSQVFFFFFFLRDFIFKKTNYAFLCRIFAIL